MKIGILGGGQLGRMLLQQAANYPVETWVLENDVNCPSAHLCRHFILGDIRDFQTVYDFGSKVDVITIEIENVNIEALEALEKDGKTVIPKPSALKTIKNKILQKEYYKENQIPTPSFVITQNKEDIRKHLDFLPAVHKLGMGGYDGKGVQIINNENDLDKAFDAPCVLEKMVDIHKEIALTVAIDRNGAYALYPPVEMVFDQQLNLLDYQICPADLEQETLWKAEAIALSVARNFRSPGLFAIELFVDNKGEVFVNETAPRVHNSGHHTIEAHFCSQFDMLWRILLGYPLGNTSIIMPSIMVNILGEPGYKGDSVYEGMEELLKLDNVFVHLYGKTITAPGRKMGHVTAIQKEKLMLTRTAHKIKNILKVKSNHNG